MMVLKDDLKDFFCWTASQMQKKAFEHAAALWNNN